MFPLRSLSSSVRPNLKRTDIYMRLLSSRAGRTPNSSVLSRLVQPSICDRHRLATGLRHNSSASSSSQSQQLGNIDEPRLYFTFTCTVVDCGHRSSHTFTKRAYEKGIVIVQCPGCKNRHLIADHLSWFKDERTQDGKLRTIEDIMRAKGEEVKRGIKFEGDTMEVAPEEDEGQR